MSTAEIVEVKELAGLKGRFLSYLRLCEMNSSNVKALKVSAKLLKLEEDRLKKLKSPLGKL